jgi:hypothetical protein
MEGHPFPNIIEALLQHAIGIIQGKWFKRKPYLSVIGIEMVADSMLALQAA